MIWKRMIFPGLVLAALVFLNIRNQCQPGWCGDYGFPLVYRHWSDEIPVINGVTYGPRFSAVALVADIVIGVGAVLAAFAASASRRRSGAHAAA